ncbi:unnamed protein product [Ixodes persulcatus]
MYEDPDGRDFLECFRMSRASQQANHCLPLQTAFLKATHICIEDAVSSGCNHLPCL